MEGLWVFFPFFPVSFLCRGFTDGLDKCGFARKAFELRVHMFLLQSGRGLK